MVHLPVTSPGRKPNALPTRLNTVRNSLILTPKLGRISAVHRSHKPARVNPVMLNLQPPKLRLFETGPRLPAKGVVDYIVHIRKGIR